MKPVDGLRVPVGLNGHKESAPELRLAAQDTGVEELHDRPEIAYVIFDGCAGEGDAPAGPKAPRGPRLLRLRILDVLRFVQHNSGPGHARERLVIAMEER